MNITPIFYQPHTTALVMHEDDIPLELPYNEGIDRLASINVGCGSRPLEGWINSDVTDTKYNSKTFDAQEKWPYGDSVFKNVYASHMLEHLPDPLGFFEEANRCIHPEGSMLLRFPHPRHSHSLADLDHKRLVPEHLFFWLGMPGDDTNNPSHMGRPALWELKIIMHLYQDESLLNHWYINRRMRHFLTEHLWNVCVEMAVWLKPIKTVRASDPGLQKPRNQEIDEYSLCEEYDDI